MPRALVAAVNERMQAVNRWITHIDLAQQNGGHSTLCRTPISHPSRSSLPGRAVRHQIINAGLDDCFATTA